MSRAVALGDACRTLKLPYTYQLIQVPAAKQAARKQLGGMAVEIIETMRDEVMEAAVSRYLSARGLTQQAIDAILETPNGAGSTSADPTLAGVEERKCETAGAPEEAGHSILSDRERAIESTILAEGIAETMEATGQT